MRIAVIGTGIAGLGAAYALSQRPRGRAVRARRPRRRPLEHGQHMVAGRTLALDTGFIVHNEDTYPNLSASSASSACATQPSEMSFSVACGALRPRVLRAAARRSDRGSTLRDRPLPAHSASRRSTTRAARSGASRPLRRPRRATRRGSGDHFLVPLTRRALVDRSRARRSTSRLAYAVRFFANHGMLGFRRHRWRTVTGGSRTLRAAPSRTGCGINLLDRGSLDPPPRRRRRAAARGRRAAALRRRRGRDARRPGAAPARGLRARTSGACSAFRDDRERDRPAHRRALPAPPRRDPRLVELPAPDCGCDDGRPTMTYYLNKLQRLDEDEHYCVTLNRTAEIDPAQDHPPLLLPPPARDAPSRCAPSPSCRA